MPGSYADIFVVGLWSAYSLFVYTPRRRAFFSVLKDADPDTWIAINCPDGIIEKTGDDQLSVRLKLLRYIWKREYLSRHNANLTAAADKLRKSSAIGQASGALGVAFIIWCFFHRT
jgi:hypothetical protein